MVPGILPLSSREFMTVKRALSTDSMNQFASIDINHFANESTVIRIQLYLLLSLLQQTIREARRACLVINLLA